MAYRVKVPDFEGPLDLLLHLIRKNALDIYTISVSEIADKYIEYMEMMHSLNLDGVGDFLVMAATLAYHKSKMLLPRSDDDEEDEEEQGEEGGPEAVDKEVVGDGGPDEGDVPDLAVELELLGLFLLHNKIGPGSRFATGRNYPIFRPKARAQVRDGIPLRPNP